MSLEGVLKVNKQYGSAIAKSASKYGVDKDLVSSVIFNESGGNPTARSKAGAIGLGQFMPDTFSQVSKQANISSPNAFNPEHSIEATALYLSQLDKKYNGNKELVLAAYNSGQGNVSKAGNKVPNIKETQDYVPKVLRSFNAVKANNNKSLYEQTYSAAEGTATTSTLTRMAESNNQEYNAKVQALSFHKSAESASFSQEFTAAMTALNLGNITEQALDELRLRSSAPEPQVGYEYNQQFAAEALHQAGIQYSQYNLDLLSKSTSTEDFRNRLDHLNGRKELDNFARQSLSSGAIQAWNMGGVLLDPTLAMSFGALPKAIVKLGLASRLTTSFGSSIAVQAAIASGKKELLSDYSIDDAVIDTVFGGLIDGSLAKGMYKPKILLSTPSSMLAVRQSTVAMSSISPDIKHFDLSTQYKWSSSPNIRTVEPFTDVEVVAHAKQLGVSEQLLLVDTKARNVVLDSLEAQKIAERNIHIANVTEAIVRGDVKVLDSISKLGITKEEALAMTKNLPNDVAELKGIISDISGLEKGKSTAKMIQDVGTEIEKIRIVSPKDADSLKAALDKASGVTDYARPELNKEGRVTFQNARKTFNSTLKKIDKAISQSKAKMNKAIDDMTELKPLIPIGDFASEYKRLQEIKDAIEKINPKLKTSVNKIKKLTEESDKIKEIIKVKGKGITDGTLSSLNRQKEIYQRVASAIDEVTHDFNKALDGIVLDRFPDELSRDLYLESLSKGINDLFGSNIKLGFKNGKVISEGEAKFFISKDSVTNPKSKVKLGIGIALALSASSAFAGDGENDTGWFGVGGFALIALGLILAPRAFGKIAQQGGILNTTKSFYRNIKGIEMDGTIKSDPLYKRIQDKVLSVDTWRTGYMESLATVLQYGNDSMKELANKMVTNYIDTGRLSAAADKQARVGAAMFNIADSSETNFHKWLIETNQKESMLKKVGLDFDESSLRLKFEELVLNHIEFGDEAGSAISDYAKTITDENNKMVKYMNQSGVDGFDAETIAKFKPNYVARLVNQTAMMKIAGTEGGVQKLIDSLSPAIASAIGKLANDPKVLKLASEYVNTIIQNSKPIKMNSINVEAMVKAMDDLGLDVSGIDVEAVAKETHSNNDVLSRGKMRIPMEFKHFVPFKISVNSEDMVVELSTIYERNAKQLMRRTTSEQYGYAAATRITGYKSFNSLMAKIYEDGTNPEVSKTMETWALSIFGRPTFDTSSQMAQNAMAVKALANVTLAFSALTTPFELLKSVDSAIGFNSSSAARKQWAISTKNFIKGIFGKEKGKDTLLAQVLQGQVNGLGGAHVSGDITLKGVDQLTNLTDEAGASFVQDTAKKMGLFGIALSHLIKMDDFYKKIANIHASTILARLAHGTANMSDGKKSLYGISDDILARMKNKIKLDKDGEIVDFNDFDEWSIEDQDAFRVITNAIVMDRSTWTTLGTVQTGAINSSAGILLSGITSFVTQSYTTQFLAKVKHGGAENYADMGLWMMAGATSYYAKAYATGRDPDHDDALRYAIMSSPVFAPVAVASMYIDPVGLSIMQKIGVAASSSVQMVVEGDTNE